MNALKMRWLLEGVPIWLGKTELESAGRLGDGDLAQLITLGLLECVTKLDGERILCRTFAGDDWLQNNIPISLVPALPEEPEDITIVALAQARLFNALASAIEFWIERWSKGERHT